MLIALCRKIVNALAANPHPLQILDLSRNWFKDAEVIPMCEAFKTQPVYRKSLTLLHLVDNRLHDAGAIALAEAFGLSPEQKAAGVSASALKLLNLSNSKVVAVTCCFLMNGFADWKRWCHCHI